VTDPARRAHLLRAAERLLLRYGPAKTTIAEVAREANVAVGSVYLEFESKEALIGELSAMKHHRVLEQVRAAIDAPGRPYAERLRALFDARTDALLAIVDEGLHACDLVHCARDGVAEAKRRFEDELRALVVELLRAGARAGELEAKRPELVADALLRAYATLAPPHLASTPRDEIPAALRALHELMLYGVVRRKK
jgi:AcrR family transcriptional regulator